MKIKKMAIALAAIIVTTGAVASDQQLETKSYDADSLLTLEIETKTLRPNCGGSCTGTGIGL